MSTATLPAGLVDRVRARLAERETEPTPTALAAAVRAEHAGVVSDAELLRWLAVLHTELVGAGPLAALLADPEVTDVVVNGPDDVRVDRGDGWQPAGCSFADDAAVQRLARRLASSAGRRLDDAHPFVDARLADGTRLHAILPPLALRGTCLSLRVLRPSRDDLAGLGARGALPGVSAAVLRQVVAARVAFLVTGGTGAGKTTLLAALLGEVDPRERVLTVEDAQELRPRHPHHVALVARVANVEGAGAVGIRELVRQALRMRPDRIVVGEVRGPEVVDLLAALNTGHDGGAGTVHANAATEIPARIEALAAQAGVDRTAVQSQLAGAFRVVVHVARVGAHRSVTEIAVLERGSDGQVVSRTVVRDGCWVAGGELRLAAVLGPAARHGSP